VRRLWERFQAMMAAVAFAEVGEVDTARQIMAEAQTDRPAEPPGKTDPSRPSRRSPSGGLHGAGSKA
jgi:hypothetical protein